MKTNSQRKGCRVLEKKVHVFQKKLRVGNKIRNKDLISEAKTGNFLNFVLQTETLKHKVIHGCGVAHIDLKPGNIIFKDPHLTFNNEAKISDSQCLRICLIDFGASIKTGECGNGFTGTPRYRAPEMILELDWSWEYDLWSVGCILYEIYCGEPLFPLRSSPDTWNLLSILSVLKTWNSCFPDELETDFYSGTNSSDLKKWYHSASKTFLASGLDACDIAKNEFKNVKRWQDRVDDDELRRVIMSCCQINPPDRKCPQASDDPFFREHWDEKVFVDVREVLRL